MAQEKRHSFVLTELLPPLSGSISFSKTFTTSYVPQAKRMSLEFPLRVEDFTFDAKKYWP